MALIDQAVVERYFRRLQFSTFRLLGTAQRSGFQPVVVPNEVTGDPDLEDSVRCTRSVSVASLGSELPVSCVSIWSRKLHWRLFLSEYVSWMAELFGHCFEQ